MRFETTLVHNSHGWKPFSRVDKADQDFGILTEINIRALKLLVTGRGKSTGCFRTRDFTFSV